MQTLKNLTCNMMRMMGFQGESLDGPTSSLKTAGMEVEKVHARKGDKRVTMASEPGNLRRNFPSLC